MKYLGLFDLGILTIIQTIIMSVGLLQLGFLNGGYRIFSLGISKESEQINNQIFTYISGLSFFLIIVWICLLPFKFDISDYLILIGIFIGILSLTCNWLTNALIAKQFYKKLNEFNLISTLLSIVALPLIYWFKIYGAIIVLLIQPVLFISMCLVMHKDLRPTQFIIDKSLIRDILKFGFIPFLTGIFTLITNQIERWSILGWLGTVSLGKFYLVFLFSSVYILIPASINNLFFPKTMRFYQERDYSKIKQVIERYYAVLAGYILVAVILTLLFLKPLVIWLLPIHLESVKYVYLILPGLILISLSEPIGLLYNASVILKPMFWAYFSSVILFIVLLAFFIARDQLSLDNFAIFRSVIGAFILLSFSLSYIKSREKIWLAK
jgi:O-antigen/teichoic acid export membrane protein